MTLGVYGSARTGLRLPRLSIACGFIVLALSACGGGGDGGSTSADLPPPVNTTFDAQFIRSWNQVIVETFTRRDTANDRRLDIDESRVYAMAMTAAHDAINAVDRRYQPYATDVRVATASPAAAVAAAIHAVLIAAVPEETAFLDERYNATLNGLASGAARDAGVALGKQTAQAILSLRAGDGANTTGTPIYSSNAPGEYRFTRCVQDAGRTNFNACGPIKPNFRSVTPWVLSASNQFRPPNPYGVSGSTQLEVLANAVLSTQYTADFEEVKAKGVAGNSTRTPQETVTAMFWQEASHESWNRVALDIAQQRNLNPWELTRLLTLLHVALADTWIGAIEAKYFFNMWRPVTAIGFADTDNNPNTTVAVCPPTNIFCWTRFGDATPPTQGYPSAQAALGGAAERVIAGVIGTDQVSFSLTTQQGPRASLVLNDAEKTRNFAQLSLAAQENANARIFLGFNFRNSTEAGLTQGRTIGDYVVANKLRPV